MKEITSAGYRELVNAFGKAKTAYDSSVLRKRWMVMIDLPTLSTILEPVPSFPPDDPELAAAVESELGGRVVQRSEREAEWRENHPGKKRPTNPRLRRLGRDLEPHLHVLEQRDIGTTRCRWPADPAAAGALWTLAARTGSALCLAHDPIRDERPGVDFTLAAGYVRTGRADVLVDRIELWLGSEVHSKNLLASLANEPRRERHAVLVFDHQSEPEYWSAVEQGVAFCPSRGLKMPADIDVLWFILGPIACRFSTDAGWRTLLMPEEAPTGLPADSVSASGD